MYREKKQMNNMNNKTRSKDGRMSDVPSKQFNIRSLLTWGCCPHGGKMKTYKNITAKRGNCRDVNRTE